VRMEKHLLEKVNLLNEFHNYFERLVYVCLLIYAGFPYNK
jgi:hypothetical protein